MVIDIFNLIESPLKKMERKALDKAPVKKKKTYGDEGH